MTGNETGNHRYTRQEKREQKLKKKREQIKKHGKGLAQIYRDAIAKRLKRR